MSNSCSPGKIWSKRALVRACGEVTQPCIWEPCTISHHPEDFATLASPILHPGNGQLLYPSDPSDPLQGQ